jgi:MinD-like ATPase involved in chromosome partitioning or flagellar assembly
MTLGLEAVPDWPTVTAVVRDDGTAEVTVNGTSHLVVASTVDRARAAVLAHVSEQTAGPLGRPVRIATTDPDGSWQLIVHPDGRVDPANTGGPAKQPRPFAPVAKAKRRLARPAVPPAAAEPAPAPSPPPAAAPLPLPTLQDLLEAGPGPDVGPATTGWQGRLRRLTGGAVSPEPSARELEHRAAVAAVQRRLAGPKTVVVVNPKGGAHKTTATLLMAATFGRHRGGYTLAWDNNETRGTLGWRATPARHTNTAVDLLRDLDRFTADPLSARVGDLDNYVRSQGSAQFGVLASDEDAHSAASIDAEAFGQLHRTLARFYRLMVVDTGNNMRASNFQAAIAAADQLVIVSTVRGDTAQSAAWLADALRAAGHEQTVAQAVTVLAAPARTPDRALSDRLRAHFGQLTRAVLDVPYDPALVPGGPLPYEHLSPRSVDAWLRVTAAVADGL